MTAPTLPHAAGAPAAPTAFLRGVERRGAVFAELLCGDPVRGDAALAVAMHAFHEAAAQAPFADWPQRFWSLLLAAPPLRDTTPERSWPAPLSALARLGTGARAALLLRLVAGLGEADAAAVLAVAPATYRLALQRALPHHPEGSADAAGWHTLAEALQSSLRQLPVERLRHLANMRETAMADRGPQRDADTRPRGLRPALWTALAACVIAFAGTFFVPTMLRGDDMPQIRAVQLPAAATPASTFDADTALLTHRDFDQLANAPEQALVRDLDFYAWYAAQAATQPVGAPLLLPDAGAPQAVPTTEGGHAPR